MSTTKSRLAKLERDHPAVDIAGRIAEGRRNPQPIPSGAKLAALPQRIVRALRRVGLID